MLNRRQFLKTTSVVSIGATAPGFFQRVARAAPLADQPGGKETVLVVVQLSGGNDGLNTVIPFKDPEYIQGRPTLKLGANEVKKINEELGFHSQMGGFAELLEQNQLSVLQGVGYPNPNRSHFESMDIWHRATPDANQPYGWLGRTMPLLKNATSMFVGGGEGPLAMFGAKGPAPQLTSLDDYQMKVSDKGDDKTKREMIEKFAQNKSTPNNDLLKLVRDSAQETYLSAERLRNIAKNYQTPITYPSTGLASRLKLVAQLIDAGVPDRVYYTEQGGYDTHSLQVASHGSLLNEFAEALNAFQKDIVHHGHQKRVLVMTFSEFGRRIKENGSRGTDHGAASQMFLIGDRVKAGVIGQHPDLNEPERGDLRFHTDFRSVYATILKQWLAVEPGRVLGDKYPELELLKQA